jgi:hypothetical protein
MISSYLGMQIVLEAGYKDVNVAHDLQNVESLFQCLSRESDLRQLSPVGGTLQSTYLSNRALLEVDSPSEGWIHSLE